MVVTGGKPKRKTRRTASKKRTLAKAVTKEKRRVASAERTLKHAKQSLRKSLSVLARKSATKSLRKASRRTKRK